MAVQNHPTRLHQKKLMVKPWGGVDPENLWGWTFRTPPLFLVSRCLTPRTVHVMCSCDVLEVVHSSAIEVRKLVENFSCGICEVQTSHIDDLYKLGL